MVARTGMDVAAAPEPKEPALARLSGRLVLLWGWKRAAMAFAAGAAGALAHAPYDFFAAAFVSFPVLVLLLDSAASDGSGGRLRRLRPSFAVGWWFGFGYFLANLWWIGNAMLVDVEKYAWAMPIAVLILPAFLALYYGLAAALARPFWNEGIGRIAALAAAFAVAEWLRGQVLTGFSWNAVGMAAMPVPMLMQSVAVVGMPGMDALATFAFALPALLAAPRGHLRVVALLVLLAGLHAGFGAARMALAPADDGRSLSVRLVQPSINQGEKWDPARRDAIFASYLEMSSAAPKDGRRPDVIVWPETSVPFLLQQRPDALAALDAMLADGQVLLAGVVRMEGESPADPSTRFYNSVVAVNDAGEIFGAADKQFLVPLGEFVPFSDLLAKVGITKLVDLPGGFSRGSGRPSIEIAPGVAAVPYICYEVIFPGIAAGTPADVLVNVTNDAWFGNTPGPYQHLRHAQLRAVEAGRPMIRAANNGITAAIDAEGRVLDALSLNAVGMLDFVLPLSRRESPVPFPAHLVGWAVVACMLVVAAGGRLRQRRLN